MSGKEFVEMYARKYNTTKKDSQEICDNFIELLNDCFEDMGEGESLAFYGFGSFKKKHLEPRVVGDLVNGGSMEIPESSKISFKRSYTRKK